MQKRLDRSLGQLITSQFIEFWPYYCGALIALIGTHAIQSELPFLAKELADTIEARKEIPVTIFLLLALGIIIFRTSSRLLFFYPARIMQKLLRVELVESIQNSTPFRYRKFPAGQLFQIVGADMEQIRALIGFALMQVGNIIVALFILIPRLASFEIKFLIALTPMFATFILFTIIVSRNRKYYSETQEMQGKLNDIIMETYNGKKTIKNYHAEEEFINLFDKFSMRELLNFYKAGQGVAVSIPLVPFGVGLSLLWGAHIVFQGQMGASSLILFSGFIYLFLEPLLFLSWIGVVFARSIVSWKRIKDLVKDLDTVTEDELNLDKLNLDTDDSFIKVPFWNQEIDIPIVKDNWLVIAGETGCGKTHILKHVIEVLKRKSKNISFVAQDPYLYSDDLESNIFLGLEKEARDLEKAYDLLKLFGLDYLSNDKESLFSLEVGENGKKLSGGQAKRLSLVKSLMSEAEYIIWDDPFSSVDMILEKEIVEELKQKNYLKGKYLILTSHRLLTVKQSDTVMLVNKEVGIEQLGLVDELISSKDSRVYEYFKNQMV